MSKHNLFIWKPNSGSRQRQEIGNKDGSWDFLDWTHLPLEELKLAKNEYSYNFNVFEARLSLQVGHRAYEDKYNPAVLILNHGVYAARSMTDYYYMMFAIPESRFKTEFGHYFSDYYALDEDFTSKTEETLIFRVDVFPAEMPEPIIVEKLTREIVHTPPEMQPPPAEDTTPYGMLHLAGAALAGALVGRATKKRAT